jgi:hypothetical protein
LIKPLKAPPELLAVAADVEDCGAAGAAATNVRPEVATGGGAASAARGVFTMDDIKSSKLSNGEEPTEEDEGVGKRLAGMMEHRR